MIAFLEEGETTYFILDNVENEVVITDTPAVRCEQITNGTDVMVSQHCHLHHNR